MSDHRLFPPFQADMPGRGQDLVVSTDQRVGGFVSRLIRAFPGPRTSGLCTLPSASADPASGPEDAASFQRDARLIRALIFQGPEAAVRFGPLSAAVVARAVIAGFEVAITGRDEPLYRRDEARRRAVPHGLRAEDP